MDRPTRIRKINLSLGLSRHVEQQRDSREGEERDLTEIRQASESSRPTEETSVCTGEKTEVQRGPLTSQVCLKVESLDSISGLLVQCALGPGSPIGPLFAMTTPLVVSLSP